MDTARPFGPEDCPVDRTLQVVGGRWKALILWDPKSLTPKKRDAIDTDQITPAADCVSESLETLDERWKAGSFRYLMPDFRARVHRGETFVVAGDRFAIGSSRERTMFGKSLTTSASRSSTPTKGMLMWSANSFAAARSSWRGEPS